jgi:hypothetical protein
MNILRKISIALPVVLFIIGRWVFDTYSPCIDNSPTVTSWQISYYIMLNVAWLVYLVRIYWDEFNDDYKFFYWILGVSFFVDIIINLLKINMSFTEYVESMTNVEQNILISGMMSALFVILMIKLLKPINFKKHTRKILTFLNIKK